MENYSLNSLNSNETIDILSDSLTILNEDLQLANRKKNSLENNLNDLSEDLVKIQLSIEETNLSIQHFNLHQDLSLQTMKSLKQTIEDQLEISTNGTFIWRITNIEQKLSRFII